MLAPISRSASVSCVSIHDGAFDVEASTLMNHNGIEILEYALKQVESPASWRELMKVKDGQTPTEFIIGVLPPSELARIEDECNVGGKDERPRELYWRCFLSGIRDIKGCDGFGGKPKMRAVDGIEYVAPDWLEECFVHHLRRIALEIGRAIWFWNQLKPAEIKN